MACYLELNVNEFVGDKAAGVKLGSLEPLVFESAWYCMSSQSYILMILPKRERMKRRFTMR